MNENLPDRIRPCPACHCEVLTITPVGYGPDAYYVLCGNPNCGLGGVQYPTPFEAINAWNKLPRIEDTELQEKYNNLVAAVKWWCDDVYYKAPEQLTYGYISEMGKDLRDVLNGKKFGG